MLERLTSEVVVTSRNIAYAIRPVVDYIHQLQPNFIVAFDRGARLFGFATHIFYNKLYGQLPTVDGKIHYRKISLKIDREHLARVVSCDVDYMCRKLRNPHVLLIDDWIHGGQTREYALGLYRDLSDNVLDIHYGVMIGKGKGADVWGTNNNFGIYSWYNQNRVVGVYYDESKFAKKTGDKRATEIRRKIVDSIKRYTKGQ